MAHKLHRELYSSAINGFFLYLFISAHNDRIYLIKFHPLAKDVLLSASQDLTVKIWNISTGKDQLTLKGHTDQVKYVWPTSDI